MSLTVVVEGLCIKVFILVVLHSNQRMLNHCLKLDVFLCYILYAVNQVSLTVVVEGLCITVFIL